MATAAASTPYATRPGGSPRVGSPWIDAVIHNWLLKRQELIRQLTALAGPGPSGSLEAFRNVLLEYISASHFEVFSNSRRKPKRST